jgi:hypothetical protein
MKTNTQWTHYFAEAGNGLPGVGDKVLFQDGWGDTTILVVRRVSCIHTQQYKPNWVYLACEPADRDWDDLTDTEQDTLFESAHHVATFDED